MVCLVPKAKAHPGQLGFAFEPPSPASAPAQLAGLERQICRTVGVILASDPRSREIIAAEISMLLDEDVSKSMLDAYSSPAREDHKVPMARFFALVAVTGRLDLLDPLLRQIGGALLAGAEVMTARIGHLRQHRSKIDEELRALERQAPMIRTSTGSAGTGDT